MKGHGQKFTRKMHHAVIALLQSPTVEGAARGRGGVKSTGAGGRLQGGSFPRVSSK